MTKGKKRQPCSSSCPNLFHGGFCREGPGAMELYYKYQQSYLCPGCETLEPADDFKAWVLCHLTHMRLFTTNKTVMARRVMESRSRYSSPPSPARPATSPRSTTRVSSPPSPPRVYSPPRTTPPLQSCRIELLETPPSSPPQTRVVLAIEGPQVYPRIFKEEGRLEIHIDLTKDESNQCVGDLIITNIDGKCSYADNVLALKGALQKIAELEKQKIVDRRANEKEKRALKELYNKQHERVVKNHIAQETQDIARKLETNEKEVKNRQKITRLQDQVDSLKFELATAHLPKEVNFNY